VFHGWWRSGEGFVYTLASERQTSMPDRLFDLIGYSGHAMKDKFQAFRAFPRTAIGFLPEYLA
jgi:hypothetical protein